MPAYRGCPGTEAAKRLSYLQQRTVTATDRDNVTDHCHKGSRRPESYWWDFQPTCSTAWSLNPVTAAPLLLSDLHGSTTNMSWCSLSKKTSRVVACCTIISTSFTSQPQVITALWLVLIYYSAQGRRLSWPGRCFELPSAVWHCFKC